MNKYRLSKTHAEREKLVRKGASNHPSRGTVRQLRLLATTDLHMQLLGYDYVTDQPKSHHGLAGLATLITQARAEARSEGRACVLLDNGDILQGNALGAWLANQPVTSHHPVATALRVMGYDAIGIGNHDLDFGLGYFKSVIRQLDMPIVCSNLRHRDLDPVVEMAILTCPGPADDGARPLRLGVLSVVPEQTAVWNLRALANQAEVLPARPVLASHAAALRKDGADLVVLLAHMGIGPDYEQPHVTDSAVPLAQIPGIDAIITGHTHRRFPGKDHDNSAGVDPVHGMLWQRPAIMAGHGGSDLAVLDLTVKQSPKGKWHVIGHVSGLRPNHADTLPCPDVMKACTKAHEDCRQHLAQPVGHTDLPLHNFFALAVPTPTDALIARAMARITRDALVGTSLADLPILACTAAHTTGGRGGPGHYIHIPKGTICRRHLAGLAPYEDPIWGVRLSGWELHHWLEHAAAVFNQHVPDGPVLRLSDETVPSFNFDTIHGLSYQIDPTQPVGHRIGAMRLGDRPVLPDDLFIMATNPFRAAGGGGFAASPPDRVCLRSKVSLSDALVAALADPDDLVWPAQIPWQFACAKPVQAILETAPQALDWLDDIRHLAPVPDGKTPDGFARLRLTL